MISFFVSLKLLLKLKFCVHISINIFVEIFIHQFILGAAIFSNTVTLDPPVFYNHPMNVYTHMPYPLILL
jgi:hypothetical protein